MLQILKCATQIDKVTKSFCTAKWMSADVILWELNPEENEDDFPWQTLVFVYFLGGKLSIWAGKGTVIL